MVDYDPSSSAPSQVLPFEDLPSTDTPVTAAWLNHVDDFLVDVNDRRAGVFDIRDFGAVGDGTTDDSGAIQAALDAADDAGRGTVYVPQGVWAMDAGVTVPTQTTIVGSSEGGSVLFRTDNGAMLKFWGSDTGAENHILFGGARDLTLDGGGFTGALLDLVYASEMNFHNIYCVGSADVAVDMVELYDSKFYNLAIDDCGSTTAPALWIRSSRASSGFGNSVDSSNQLQFYGLRVETWVAGAIKIEPGTGGVEIHSIYLSGLKIESFKVRGPAINVTGTARNINLNGGFIHMESFDSGFSTAQNAIDITGEQAVTVRNFFLSNGATATIARGVNLNSFGCHLDGVYGSYVTNPTVAHVAVAGTGSHSLNHLLTSGGTLVSGTLTTTPVVSPPIRAVAGAVSDSSFPSAPPTGTLAVDTTNNRLYVKDSDGTWKFAALS